MKRSSFIVTAILFVAVFILSTVPQNACAQLSKKQEKTLQKERDKEYKRKITEYKKEGWKLGASSQTIEVALLEHYKKLAQSDKNVEFTGEVSQCKSINICRQFALTNAQNRYASLASGNVKGRIMSLLRADSDIPETEIDKFIAEYENNVKAEVSGVLTESYSLVKDNGDGTKSYQTIFILNEEKAGIARKLALERSLKDTKITNDEAGEITKFVDERFPVDLNR